MALKWLSPIIAIIVTTVVGAMLVVIMDWKANQVSLEIFTQQKSEMIKIILEVEERSIRNEERLKRFHPEG